MDTSTWLALSATSALAGKYALTIVKDDNTWTPAENASV